MRLILLQCCNYIRHNRVYIQTRNKEYKREVESLRGRYGDTDAQVQRVYI